MEPNFDKRWIEDLTREMRSLGESFSDIVCVNKKLDAYGDAPLDDCSNYHLGYYVYTTQYIYLGVVEYVWRSDRYYLNMSVLERNPQGVCYDSSRETN